MNEKLPMGGKTMNVRNDYLCNRKTIAVFSNFHLGNEYSGVLQGKNHFTVRQSPLEIIQNSFLNVGGDLEGALRSSRFHLDKKCPVPAALSVSTDFSTGQARVGSNTISLYRTRSSTPKILGGKNRFGTHR
jgi:hypothetical protein